MDDLNNFSLTKRKQMRHSSWTLFLVPLALPLVFLFLPGSMKSSVETSSPAGENSELVQDQLSLPPDGGGAYTGSLEEKPGDVSEGLFKD